METWYSTREMADMMFCYGQANGSNLGARNLYAAKYPHRRRPSVKMFSTLFQRLSDTGSFAPRTQDRGRPRTTRTPDLEQRVLEHVEENPGTSVRRISAVEGVAKSVVWNILHEQLLYPYHVQRVQALQPHDRPGRMQFCQWFLQMCAHDPHFTAKVLFTDEAGFTRDGIVNFHNTHVWADANPYALEERRNQQRFCINVWAGIHGDRLIGPYVLPHTLNGARYLNFLQNQLPVLLENVPIHERVQMWYMHDGAPAHFHLRVRQQLTRVFHERWIGRGGPIPWPARSPELNPLDFWLWGHLKTLVYAVPINDVDTLRERVVNVCDAIRQQPGVFQRMRESMRRRMEGCIAMDGGHIEHML